MNLLLISTSNFEYVTSITFIVLGLTLTDVLGSIGGWIKNKHSLSGGVLVGLASLLLIITILQKFWRLLQLQLMDKGVEFEMKTFMLSFVSNVLVYLIGRIVLPDFSSSDVTSFFTNSKAKTERFCLDSYFLRHARKLFFLCFLLLITIQWLDLSVYNAEIPFNQYIYVPRNQIRAMMILVFSFAFFYAHWIRKSIRHTQEIHSSQESALWVFGGSLVMYFGLLAQFITV